MLLHGLVVAQGRLSYWGGEVEEPWWFGQLQGVPDLLPPAVVVERWAILPSGVARVTRCIPVELVAHVAPGVGAGVLNHPDQQQGEPAQLDVGADPVLAVVEHGPQPERAFHVPPAPFDGQQLLVCGGQVLAGQGQVGGAQQPLAVQVGLCLDGGSIDAQQPSAAQVAAQPGLGLERPNEPQAREDRTGELREPPRTTMLTRPSYTASAGACSRRGWSLTRAGGESWRGSRTGGQRPKWRMLRHQVPIRPARVCGRPVEGDQRPRLGITDLAQQHGRGGTGGRDQGAGDGFRAGPQVLEGAGHIWAGSRPNPGAATGTVPGRSGRSWCGPCSTSIVSAPR